VVTADTRERDGALLRERYANLGPSLPERGLEGAVGTREVRYYLSVDDDGSSKD
jgi:hypothetical protein